MTPTLEQLKASRKICEAARPGPYYVQRFESPNGGGFNIRTLEGDDDNEPPDDGGPLCAGYDSDDVNQDRADFELFAHARTMLPATLELVREMYEVLVALDFDEDPYIREFYEELHKFVSDVTYELGYLKGRVEELERRMEE